MSSYAYRRASALFAVLTTGYLTSCAGRTPPENGPLGPSTGGIEGISFVAPTPGSYLFTNRLVHVFVRPEPRVEAGLSKVDASLVVSGVGGTVTVATGDLRSLMEPHLLHAIWDPRHLPPGAYELIFTVRTGADELVAQAEVELREPPRLDAQVLGSRAGDGGIVVELAVEAATAAPARIVSYLWEFGDSSTLVTTEVPTIEHLYSATGETHTLTVEVHDSLGGTNLTTYDLTLPDQPQGTVILQAAATCGCRQMTIIYQALPQSSRYCAAAVPPIPGLAAVAGAVNPPCPPGQVAFRANLGDLNPPPSLGVGFEVEAILNPGSQPAICTEGQYVMNTFRSGGAVVPNPNTPPAPPGGNITLPTPAGGTGPFTFTAVASPAPPGAPVPAPPFVAPPVMGPAPPPTFGADDYDAASIVKEHRGLTIRWVDLPQFPPGGGAASMDSEFVAFVTGTTGTCWCDFRVNRTQGAGGAVGGAGITLVQGLNCRIR